MPRFFYQTLILVCFCSPALKAQEYQQLLVPFYSESLKVSYAQEMFSHAAPSIDDQALSKYFQLLSSSDYKPFLNSIQQLVKIFQLNDWMHYQLLKKALYQIYGQERATEVELACWFLLSQSGFDTQLAYLDEQVFLFVYTREQIFEAPTIQFEGKNYINLTSLDKGQVQQEALYMLIFQPNPNGKPFSFKLHQLPTLKPTEKTVNVKYRYNGNWEEIKLVADANVKAYMSDYPKLQEVEYMNIPFSTSLSKSLLPQLQKLIDGKSSWEAVSFLASFTRSAFSYKEDKDFFGYSKPMAAEEVFLQPYSDCEDRSALFYNLVQQLLDLPMVVIAYSNHLTIGVALPKTKPGAFYHEGRAYYICDPTGPATSSEIGVIPQGYENEPFKVLSVQDSR
jgi:hypothetical protein